MALCKLCEAKDELDGVPLVLGDFLVDRFDKASLIRLRDRLSAGEDLAVPGVNQKVSLIKQLVTSAADSCRRVARLRS